MLRIYKYTKYISVYVNIHLFMSFSPKKTLHQTAEPSDQ